MALPLYAALAAIRVTLDAKLWRGNPLTSGITQVSRRMVHEDSSSGKVEGWKGRDGLKRC